MPQTTPHAALRIWTGRGFVASLASGAATAIFGALATQTLLALNPTVTVDGTFWSECVLTLGAGFPLAYLLRGELVEPCPCRRYRS